MSESTEMAPEHMELWKYRREDADRNPEGLRFRQNFQKCTKFYRPNSDVENDPLTARVLNFIFNSVSTQKPGGSPAPKDINGRTLVHWRVNIELEALDGLGPYSVVVDLSKADENDKKWGRIGEICWETRPYTVSSNVFTVVTCPPTRMTRLNDVIALVTSAGLPYFTIDEQRSGCMYWMRSFAWLLERRGVIAEGSLAGEPGVTSIDESIIQLRTGPRSVELWAPLDGGQFQVVQHDTIYTPAQLIPPAIRQHHPRFLDERPALAQKQ